MELKLSRERFDDRKGLLESIDRLKRQADQVGDQEWVRIQQFIDRSIRR